MKGVVVVTLIAAVLFCGLAVANPPIQEPKQYEQFCEHQLVSGTGYVDTAVSIVDKKIALEYYDMMSGNGDLEMDSTHVYSQEPDKLKRDLPNCSENGTGVTEKALNLFENTKLTYDGSVTKTPLSGGKFINSKRFYGGIDAQVQEMFSVNQMEKDQTTYFGSTNNSSITHTVGLNTLNSFNGTWGTDASMHKIFYKDIKSHEMFSGDFEIQKEIKFHEAPIPDEDTKCPCEGVDC